MQYLNNSNLSSVITGGSGLTLLEIVPGNELLNNALQLGIALVTLVKLILINRKNNGKNAS